MFIIADAADGADGVMQLVLAYGRYPKCTEERPVPAVTGRPARAGSQPVGANLQKVGCASRPLRSVGHDLAHAGRHWVGVDNVLDRVAPIVRISGFDGARRSKRALAGNGPEREVSHARQPLEAYLRQHA